MEVRGRVLSSLLCAVLVSAGCAPAPATDPQDTGPIVFADGKDTSQGAQIKGLVAQWNNGHPDEQVRMVELPESNDDHRAQVVAHAQDAASGSGCYDVVSIDVIWTAEFARWGYVVPLGPDDFRRSDFLERPIESARYRGRVWAIPLRTDVGLLYYRKDVLDAAGVRYPKTWAELRRQAMTLAPGAKLNGYVSQFDRYEGFTVNALESIWGAGADGFGQDAEAGFGRLVQGFSEGWIPREATGFNEERSRIAFQDGRALFLRNWTYAYRLLARGALAGRFGVAPLPWPSALGGWNVALSRCSERRGTAREFIRFLTSEASQRTLFEKAGFAPSRRALYRDPRLRDDHAFLSVLETSFSRTRNRPVTPYYGQVTNTVQAHLHGVLSRPALLDDEMARLAVDARAAAEGR